MAWIKAFHIIFMVTWFSGLFYLPRLFVYHAMATDPVSIDRFKIMERKLYFAYTWLWFCFYLEDGCCLVAFLAIYI